VSISRPASIISISPFLNSSKHFSAPSPITLSMSLLVGIDSMREACAIWA
jgi:hypothetical protein